MIRKSVQQFSERSCSIKESAMTIRPNLIALQCAALVVPYCRFAAVMGRSRPQNRAVSGLDVSARRDNQV
jgi:hypothetical protein